MQLINDLLKKPSQNSIGGRKYHDMACDSKNVWIAKKCGLFTKFQML